MKKILVLVSLLSIGCSSTGGKVVEVCLDNKCSNCVHIEEIRKDESRYVYIRECRSRDDTHHHSLYFMR